MLFGPPLVIYLISPQSWGELKVSKHHYAAELAALGHTVYFLEPPMAANPVRPAVSQTSVPGVFRVAYRTWFPYRLKFHARTLFDLLMRGQARLLEKAIGRRANLVWDFDCAFQFADLRAFEADLRIFHPVDNIALADATEKNADVVLSVARPILDRLPTSGAHRAVVPHGLHRAYEAYASRGISAASSGRRRHAKIGYVGNLAHAEIDWATIRLMAEACPEATFHFIGPRAEVAALPALGDLANCEFPGRKTAEEILAEAESVDLWLACYTGQPGSNGALNSHKMLEYMAMGQAILSNRIDAYVGNPLVSMPASSGNGSMPTFLREVLASLDKLNSVDLRAQRQAFSLQHSYGAHLKRIDELLLSSTRGPNTATEKSAM